MVIKIDRATIQKKNILNNSFNLFKEKGYSRTTTREIANASGINKGLLHYYYKQKEDIIIEMYTDILNGLYNYIDSNYNEKIKGFTYYAVLNILFFRTMTSTSYFIDILSEMTLNRNLTKIKIEKTADSCFRIIENFNIPNTKYQLLLAITVAVGAEAELLISIKDEKIKMTYDKLATTINKLVLTMLKISENDIKNINVDSMKIADNISIDDIIIFLKRNYAWIQGL